MSKFGRRALHTEPPHWSNKVSYLLTRQDIVPSRALEMWNGMSSVADHEKPRFFEHAPINHERLAGALGRPSRR